MNLYTPRPWVLGLLVLTIASFSQSCTRTGSGIEPAGSTLGCGDCLRKCVDFIESVNNRCITQCSAECPGFFGHGASSIDLEKASGELSKWRAARDQNGSDSIQSETTDLP